MADEYYDRWGKIHYGDDAVPVKKRGFFAVLVKDEKVLLTYPSHIKVPEFPGGSMRRDENFRDCLFRKLYEETGIDFMLDKTDKAFHQVINTFDEQDRPYGIYYIYDQTYYLYDASSYGFDVHRTQWKTPENSTAVWVALEDIVSGKTKINFAHWKAVQNLFNVKE